MLNREAFLAMKAAVPVEKVDLPEMSGSVFVKGMTAKERSAFEKQFQTPSGKPNKVRLAEVRERIVVATVCDESKNLLFTEADIPVIGELPAAVVERLVSVAQRLCGMTNQDVESLAGNSGETADAN